MIINMNREKRAAAARRLSTARAWVHTRAPAKRAKNPMPSVAGLTPAGGTGVVREEQRGGSGWGWPWVAFLECRLRWVTV